MSARATRCIGLMLLLCSIVLSAVGQLAMKVGMQQLSLLSVAHKLSPTFTSVPALEPALFWTAGGLASYGLSLLVWLAVLVRYPLSYAYPLLSLSYVLVYIGATQWERLMEPATTLRTAGTSLIIAGVVLVSLTNERGSRGQGGPDT